MNTPQTRRENEIWQACDDLWALNATFKQVTGDAIRERLVTLGYKKGAPNEIYKYRRTWQDSRGVAHDATQEAEPSDPISRAVAMVYEQIHGQKQSELETLRTERDEIALAMLKLQGELSELSDEADALRSVCGQNQGELNATKQQLETVTQQANMSEQIYAKISREREQEAERWRALTRDWSEQLMQLKTENRLLAQQRSIDNTKRSNRIRALELQLAALRQALKDQKHVARLAAAQQSSAKRLQRKQSLQKPAVPNKRAARSPGGSGLAKRVQAKGDDLSGVSKRGRKIIAVERAQTRESAVFAAAS